MIKKLAASTVRNLSDSARHIHNPKGLADDILRALAYENGQVIVRNIIFGCEFTERKHTKRNRHIPRQTKGKYF